MISKKKARFIKMPRCRLDRLDLGFKGRELKVKRRYGLGFGL